MNPARSPADLASEVIKNKRSSFQPSVGIILGSGLSPVADELEDAISIPYLEIPGFPRVNVAGHSGQLRLGYWKGVSVACLQGRAHDYQGESEALSIKTYVRTLKRLGCETLFLSNAAGSLREEMEPGTLMLVQDHINLLPSNPLVGPNDEEFGPRFYPLDNAYDEKIRVNLRQIAEKNHIPLQEGIYLATLGPHYETAAEIRAFKHLGADAVGMSTVPEVLLATHCGMRVAAISVISNFATGLSRTIHSHESVLEVIEKARAQFTVLLGQYLESLA